MMARQILFRGKDIKSGKWRVGRLVDLDGDLSGQVFIVPMFSGASSIPVRHIVEYSAVSIDPKTVGQFTGTRDKHGRKIFEGDICRIGNLIYEVEFRYSSWHFRFSLTNKIYCHPYFNSHCGERCEVIGNIYDNPELLEGKEKEGAHE